MNTDTAFAPCAPIGSTAWEAAPLVDEQPLAMLRSIMETDEFVSLVRTGIAS